MSPVRLQRATRADLDFAFGVTESSMRGYVEQTWGKWERDSQRESHRRSFKPETHSVVLVGEAPAGILAVEEHPGHVQIEKLYLLPAFRNRGVGAELLLRVLQQSCKTGKPVRLCVLAVNTSAQRFYLRHRFAVTGATKERLFMQALSARADETDYRDQTARIGNL